jgi:hypothetical protein
VIICSFALAACGDSGSAEREIPADAKFSAAPTNKKPGSATKELSMPPGATSLAYKGTLEPNKDAEFLIAGQQGTVFMTHALTPEHDLNIEVYRADTGERITDEQPSNPAFFMARLPATLVFGDCPQHKCGVAVHPWDRDALQSLFRPDAVDRCHQLSAGECRG